MTDKKILNGSSGSSSSNNNNNTNNNNSSSGNGSEIIISNVLLVNKQQSNNKNNEKLLININNNKNDNNNKIITNNNLNNNNNNKLKEINYKNDKTSSELMDYTKLTNSGGGGACVSSSNNVGVSGGRLQFFKDGKCILELANNTEGEKGKWVSVPRKTNKRQFNVASVVMSESSASLSLSDDNSSIQSSPRQRERNWKQIMPRKNISKRITLVLNVNNKLIRSIRLKEHQLISKLKRRPCEDLMRYCSSNNTNNNSVKDTEQILLKSNNDNKNENNKKTDLKIREKINIIAQKLTDKVIKKSSVDQTKSIYYYNNDSNKIILPSSSTSRILDVQYNQHVSPRKRILKELEKVSLDDNTKRSRPKGASSSSTSANTSKLIENISKSNNRKLEQHQDSGGTSAAVPVEKTDLKQNPKQYSSYSINSLLGNLNNSRSKSPIESTKATKENRTDLSNKTVQYCSTSTRDAAADAASSIDFENNYSTISSGSSNNSNNNNNSLTENYKKQHFKKINLASNAVKASEKHQQHQQHNFHHTSLSPSSKYLAGEDLYKNHHSPENSPGFTLNHNAYSSPFIPISKFVSNPNESVSSYDIKRLNRLNEIDSSSSSSSTIKSRKIRESQASPTSTEDLSHATTKHSNFNEEIDSGNRKISSPRQEITPKTLLPPPSHTIPTPPLYYLYGTPNGLPHSSPYIPTAVPYYHPYATSLRNSLWMNYQSGISAGIPPSLARLPAGPFYNYNGMPTLSSSVESLQINSLKSNLEQKSISTNSVTVYVNEDCNSDVPLNLSKH